MDNKISNYRRFLIDRLGYLRTRAKFSGRELSLRLDKTPTYIGKFERGVFSIPAEVLLEAIEICNSTPEEFFSPNIDKFKEHQELLAKYDKLSPQSKQNLLNIIDSLK